MKKRRIDIIVKYFYPVAAGIETNIMETYSVLAQKGWDITIHTSKDTYQKKNILPNEEVIRGMKVKRYSFSNFGFMPKIDYKNVNIIALHNFDMFPHSILLIRYVLMKLLGRKNFTIILTPHGGYNPEWRLFDTVQKLIKKTYHETLGKWLINYVVDVRAVSEWEKSEMSKAGVNKEKIEVISNGLENEAFMDVEKLASPKIKNLTKGFGRYILDDARIYEIKNQETIIRALPLIPKDIKFVNIGTIGSTVGNQLSTDAYYQKLKKLAEDLGVGDRVIFPGVIRGADKYYLYKHALCFVHMATWESFCNVVHQAISQSLVCIAANNTALPYLVKDKINGFLVDTRDHKTLAEKVNYILDPKNQKEVENIKKYNLLHGRNNSWTHVADNMNQWYQSLIK